MFYRRVGVCLVDIGFTAKGYLDGLLDYVYGVPRAAVTCYGDWYRNLVVYYLLLYVFRWNGWV